jgi:hypothetical protein
MDAWSWPTVNANSAARVYVEFGQKGNQKDDGGEAVYNIAGTPSNFQVKARKPDDFMLTISMDNVATKTSP